MQVNATQQLKNMRRPVTTEENGTRYHNLSVGSTVNNTAFPEPDTDEPMGFRPTNRDPCLTRIRYARARRYYCSEEQISCAKG